MLRRIHEWLADRFSGIQYPVPRNRMQKSAPRFREIPFYFGLRSGERLAWFVVGGFWATIFLVALYGALLP